MKPCCCVCTSPLLCPTGNESVLAVAAASALVVVYGLYNVSNLHAVHITACLLDKCIKNSDWPMDTELTNDSPSKIFSYASFDMLYLVSLALCSDMSCFQFLKFNYLQCDELWLSDFGP